MTIPAYVIDASVFLASMQQPELARGDARALLQYIATKNWQVYAPMIVLPEITGSLARNKGSLAHAQNFIWFIRRQVHVEIVNIDERLGYLAADLAAQQHIRGCDAVYVALAQMRNAILITLDQEQRQRVPPGITARTPAEELGFLQNLNN
ncbi:hypothetical protein BH10CHL1_BH10CHL1_39990 [soil metagenome]